MGRILILAVALAGLWLLLSGYFDKPLLLGFGAASVALSVWLADSLAKNTRCTRTPWARAASIAIWAVKVPSSSRSENTTT